MRILAAALESVESGAAVQRAVRRDGHFLVILGKTLDLRTFRRVAVISIGKAGAGMAAALGAILGDSLDAGLIVTKQASRPPRGYTLLIGGHPIPNESSLLAGRRVLELAASLTRPDLLLCLISGGGSALVTSPVEGVTLADVQMLTTLLLACGARIDEINILRRALDRVKGGGLARATAGARVITLIMSDVVGNPLEAIASGPTIPNPTGPAEALAVLEKYELSAVVPASIVAYLRSLRPSGAAGAPADVHIIASNLDALQAAVAQAKSEGLRSQITRSDLQGEARQAGADLAEVLRGAAARRHSGPVLLAAGGETTVSLHGDGRGGRNTELALASAIALADQPGVMLATLATDGEDGPTDAAGAVVNGETCARARALGLDPSDFLGRNDSYSFFSPLDDLFRIGATGTNVNDLVLMFAW
jgi:hydroxypyruvate reductase